MRIIHLYVDGGVIRRNPSPYGGTWAYVKTFPNGEMIGARSGFIRPIEVDPNCTAVTNNQTEMLAMLYGLESLSDTCIAIVHSDSMITLGRTFGSFRWKNIPEWMHKFYQEQRRRLIYWNSFQHVLLAGHPSKADLACGFGKHGYQVSEWNVLCDKLCNDEADRFMEKMG